MSYSEHITVYNAEGTLCYNMSAWFGNLFSKGNFKWMTVYILLWYNAYIYCSICASSFRMFALTLGLEQGYWNRCTLQKSSARAMTFLLWDLTRALISVPSEPSGHTPVPQQTQNAKHIHRVRVYHCLSHEGRHLILEGQTHTQIYTMHLNMHACTLISISLNNKCHIF